MDSVFVEPFDWLFSWNDIEQLMKHLLPFKNAPSFIIGCGNAPFSVDMHNAGYYNTINADYSEVAIAQQKKKFPDMNWVVMDAMGNFLYFIICLQSNFTMTHYVHTIETKLASGSMPVIVDKSLIDTVLCYKER